jgi:hypothetical protein
MLFSRGKPSNLPAAALARQAMALARDAGWILEELHEQNYVFPSVSFGSRRQTRKFMPKKGKNDVKLYRITLTLLLILPAALILSNPALAADSSEKKGWGIDDPYNRLYNPKEFEKIKARVLRVMEVVPMAGMSTATALEVSEGSKPIMVHLCPTWFAKPSDIGLKPGDQVVLKGCWAEINGKDVFLASKVKKGDYYEFKCRLTIDGTPFWTMTPEQLAKEQAEKDD